MIGNEGDPVMYETYDLSPSILHFVRPFRHSISTSGCGQNLWCTPSG
jgi:hypothetical protein